jgi:predicted CoA-binding protein
MLDRAVVDLLRSARTVAVLGAHVQDWRPAYYVPESLHDAGLRILPVNPLLLGQQVFGEPFRASLAELHEPVDVVDVFRRPSHLAAHLDDVLAMDPAPRLVWLQSGIEDHAFAAALRAAGIPTVQDRCLMVEYRRLAA